VKKYVLNKHGKFGIKMFLLYTDITIFTLGHFILLHPVLLSCMNQLVSAKLLVSAQQGASVPIKLLYSSQSSSFAAASAIYALLHVIN